MPIEDPKKARYYQVTSDPNAQFWVMNLLGWFGISLITYFSLSLPYNQFELSYLAHNVLQSVLGLILCLPMRYIFRVCWAWPTPLRIVISVVTVLVLSTSWAAARLLLFMAMTGERGLWGDFGGWLFPSIFVFLTWAALYHGVKYHQLLQREHEQLLVLESQQRREALRRTEAESAARESQLQLLRYQLNPHFLFNTLNAVTALISTRRAEEAKNMLFRLSRFLRYSLESDDQLTVALDQEFEAALLYLEIEKERFSDRLSVSTYMDSGLGDIQVPGLILQPLLENAVKYAIAQSEQGGTIRITALAEGTDLLVSVEDSGVKDSSVKDSGSGATNKSKNRSEMSTGIGLKNARARLKNLYGERGRVEVEPSSLGGICVAIRLPMTGSEPPL